MITTIILIAAEPTQSAKGEITLDAGLWLDSATHSRVTMASTADLRRAFHGHRRLWPREASADRIVMKHRDLLGGSGARRRSDMCMAFNELMAS